MKLSITYIIFSLSCVILTFFTYRILLWNKNLNITKKNDHGIRWASQSKPILGGVGFYAAFIFSAMYYLVFVNYKDISSGMLWILVACSTIGLITGIIDDTKSSSPNFKFGMQIFIGIIFIVSGNHITCFSISWVNYIVTVFWVVALMNSINMLDNMDAITTSVSAVILTLMILVGYTVNIELFIPFIGLGVLISLLTFLNWNWNPSKMYMGDNGSQFLGAFIAFMGIKTLWNQHNINIPTIPTREISAVILSFIVPISDTATVTINRLKLGKSPFVGGRDHTTHHLSYMGLSERMVAITLILISILFNLGSYYILCVVETFTAYHTLMCLSAALIAFLALYSTTIFAKPNK